MNKYKNTSIKGKRAAKIRWCLHEEKISKKIEKVKNSKDYLLNLVRLLGFLAGDGSMYIHGKKSPFHYNICFYPDNKEVADLFIKSFNRLYGLSPSLKIAKNYYRIRISSKIAYFNLCSISTFGALKWSIPSKILATKQLKREWLRAFFDCEGYVGAKQIQVQSVNFKGLKQVNRLLNEFGIESKIYKYKRKNPKWNINYILSINRKDSRRNYLKEISFNHTKKQEKLKSMLVCQNG